MISSYLLKLEFRKNSREYDYLCYFRNKFFKMYKRSLTGCYLPDDRSLGFNETITRLLLEFSAWFFQYVPSHHKDLIPHTGREAGHGILSASAQ